MDLQHILAIPVPIPGHIIPMLNLCRKLIQRGKLQQQLDLPTQGVISVELIPAVLPPFFTDGDDQILLLAKELDGTALPALKVATDLAKRTSLPISCVIADIGLAWAQDTANTLKVPRFALSILALAELVIGVHMPHLISQGTYDPFKDESWKSTDLIRVPGLPPLQASDIPQVSRFPKSNKIYWEFLLRQYGRAGEAKGILVNSCFDLEKKGYEALVQNHNLPIHFVGPLLTPPPKLQSKLPCMEWLNKKSPKSVLYISFGTFLQYTSSQLEEILFGIQETGYSFLLVFRKDVLEDKASPALEEFLEKFSDEAEAVNKGESQGCVVAWAPQVEVLNHPCVGGFFTHYGWNSVSESISSGVPMMGKAILGDQFVMRKLVIEEWKVGVKLEEDDNGIIFRNAVTTAVMKLMSDTEIHANVARLKDCINKAVSEGGESYNALNLLNE